jgi:hypothetical protein
VTGYLIRYNSLHRTSYSLLRLASTGVEDVDFVDRFCVIIANGNCVKTRNMVVGTENELLCRYSWFICFY